MKKRLLSWLLVLTMIFSMVPGTLITASAAEVQTTLTLGNAIWKDNTKQKFTYPAAMITSSEKKFTMMSVTVSAGAVATTANGVAASFTDIAVGGVHQSATWVFSPAKDLADVQDMLRQIEFTYAANMKIMVQVDANVTDLNAVTGKPSQLSYNSDTGHYYLYVQDRISWSNAYNKAKTLKFVGMQGYPEHQGTLRKGMGKYCGEL